MAFSTTSKLWQFSPRSMLFGGGTTLGFNAGVTRTYALSLITNPFIPLRQLSGGPFVTPFVKITPTATTTMERRMFLLGQPAEFFRCHFIGRIPTVQEKIDFIEAAVQRMASFHIYENDIYRVEATARPPFTLLSITRRDGRPCKDWYDFQKIKNELLGPECEAVELFPAESRLVDAGNEYHLWAYTDPRARFSLGFQQRFILNTEQTHSRDRVSPSQVTHIAA